MKEFLLLIRESAHYAELSAEEMHADIQEHIQWVETLVEQGNFKGGNPLDGNGVTLHGDVLTDGPFVESKECISGYYFLLANSLEEAAALAKGCPDLKRGARLEVREIIDADA
ncbi:YciI family protein [Sphingobacterium sp. MYb382]|uniref:YciI family protein n=1 Tax=Sphingobacterium sp. MYb382 TaxID=2745278 RepID=UPI0030B779DE